MKHHFNKENCQSKVRKSGKDFAGRNISLVGQHAFGWAIITELGKNKCRIQEFSNSAKARIEFKKLTKK